MLCRDAVQRLRLDGANVAHGSQDEFAEGGHTAFHFLRQQIRIGPDNADTRNIDLRQMSVGVVWILNTPSSRIRTANTMKVSGRSNANGQSTFCRSPPRHGHRKPLEEVMWTTGSSGEVRRSRRTVQEKESKSLECVPYCQRTERHGWAREDLCGFTQ
jgi:hypothetical protein